MKKSTKYALVLGAMAAMTIGSASMASADQVWEQTSDGWTCKVDGTVKKNGWLTSEASGLVYYFEDGLMVTDTFVDYKGKTYYLGSNGAMCAGGWVSLDEAKDLAVYEDAEIPTGAYTIKDSKGKDIAAKACDDDEIAWFYFKEDGSLAKNTWVEGNTGLWYYLADTGIMLQDGEIYVKGSAKDDEASYYMLDESGAMCSNTWYEVSKTKNDGTPVSSKDSTGNWVYYQANGKKLTVDKTTWKKVNGTYYAFNQGGQLITDSFVKTDDTFFYVDKDGLMVTGEEYKADGKEEILAVGATESDVNSLKDTTFKFGTDGNIITGVSNGSYYYQANAKNVTVAVTFGKGTSYYTLEVGSEITPVKGAKVKNAIIKDKDGNVYLLDENGDIVKNVTIKIGDKKVAVKASGKIDVAGEDEAGVVVGSLTLKEKK